MRLPRLGDKLEHLKYFRIIEGEISQYMKTDSVQSRGKRRYMTLKDEIDFFQFSILANYAD